MDLGERDNSLNSLDLTTISEGIGRQSCLWTTGVLACGGTGRASVTSMSTMRLEGVGEGMFAELAEDMMV